MKKYEITITEKLTYTKKAEVEVPDDMSEGEFERFLDKIERSVDSSGDIPYLGDRVGVKVTLINPDDWSSPDRSEIEIDEYDEIKE